MGIEDKEEEGATEMNLDYEETPVQGKDPPVSVVSDPEHDQNQNPSENVDLQTGENDDKNLELPTDNNDSINKQTSNDAYMNDNVEGLDGDSKHVKMMESEDNNDKGSESPIDGQGLVKSAAAADDETKNDASVVDVSANGHLVSDNDGSHELPLNQLEDAAFNERSELKAGNVEKMEEMNGVADVELSPEGLVKESKLKVDVEGCEVGLKNSNLTFLYENPVAEGEESGTEEEQIAFVKEVEFFYKERSLEFKHPKFYKEDLNLLKLWRAVIKLGGYDEVTSCKLWRQVGESFNPPKTCTTVSWTFRIFYEKALLEYEKHRMHDGEHPFRDDTATEPTRIESQAVSSPSLGSGRARRDAAARAMQGWHSKRLLGSGEVCQPVIKEKNLGSTPRSDRQIKNIGVLKRKKPSGVERSIQVGSMRGTNSQLDTMVIDIGPPADWVKINVQKTSDCFEVYALVPGLLREEVHVQSDPAGRLVISGQPEQLDNPWGVTPFKKVVSLPSRIDPHHTSAVVTLHGQLFVRVPFEQSDM